MVRERDKVRAPGERGRRLRAAAEAVRSGGLSLRQAEQLFGVSKSAIQRAVKRERARAEESGSGEGSEPTVAWEAPLDILAALCRVVAGE